MKTTNTIVIPNTPMSFPTCSGTHCHLKTTTQVHTATIAKIGSGLREGDTNENHKHHCHSRLDRESIVISKPQLWFTQQPLQK